MNPTELSLVSKENMHRDLFCLCRDPFSFRTVSYTVPYHEKNSLDECDEWLKQRLESIPDVKVSFKANKIKAFRCSFDSTIPRGLWYAPPLEEDPWHDAHSVVAELPGTDHADEIIYLLSHKDSQSWINGPGALDNGTGIVANLELVRILAALPRHRTVRVLFCNEEHWPWRSFDEASEAKKNGDNVIAVLNVDSLCGCSDEELAAGKKLMVTLYSTPEGRPLAEFVSLQAAKYGIPLECSVNQREVSDDDGSFVSAGYPRAVVSQGTHPYADSQYHLPGDIPERIDYDCLLYSTQVLLAAVRELDENGWRE